MLTKPVVNEPFSRPDRPDLAHFAKKPDFLKLVTEENLPALHGGVLTSQEKTELIRVLEAQLAVSSLNTPDVPFEPDLKLVETESCSSPDIPDDSGALEAWLASYTPIPNNVVYLVDRDKHTKRHASGQRVRARKGTKHSTPNLEFKASNPVKGWWLQRPPTLEQLFSSTKRQVEYLAEVRVKRLARINGLKNWMAANRAKRKRTVSNVDELYQVAAANDSRPVESYDSASFKVFDRALGYRLESERLRSWLLKHDPKYFGETGLQSFFRHTGVPMNDNSRHAEYWEAQAKAAERYTPEELYQKYRFYADETLREEWWESKTIHDADRYQHWLVKNTCLGDTFMPDKVKVTLKSSRFERKLAAYAMCIDRIDTGDQASIDRVPRLRKELFTSTSRRYLQFTNRVHPMVAVGEPYGDFDKEEKRELIRKDNKQHASKQRETVAKNVNAGKVWPNLGLPNRSRTRQDEELTRRITARIFSEENVRKLIHEEMSEFTAAMVAEFTVAMEDCVERVVQGAADAISKAKATAATQTDAPEGYSVSDSGIILPHGWLK